MKTDELAKLTDMSVESIRHYEEPGLMPQLVEVKEAKEYTDLPSRTFKF